MSKELFFEDEIIDDELEQVWIVAEALSRDITEQLADLHTQKGAGFISMLKEITQNKAFSPLKEESNIYTTGSTKENDYENLLNAARKAVEHGYTVYILPNPKGFRTADFIFERKGVYKMFDLKTISGKSSVSNRLLDSIGQANHILLNMTTNYNARLLAKDISLYFRVNTNAFEVLIFKGSKSFLIKRNAALDKSFVKKFMFAYNK